MTWIGFLSYHLHETDNIKACCLKAANIMLAITHSLKHSTIHSRQKKVLVEFHKKIMNEFLQEIRAPAG